MVKVVARVTLGCASAHSPVFREKLQQHDPKVATYVERLLTSLAPCGSAYNLPDLADLRHDAAVGIIERQLDSNDHCARFEYVTLTRNQVNTFGSVMPWLNCANSNNDITGFRLYQKMECTSCLGRIIQQKNNISPADLTRHNSNATCQKLSLEVENVHEQQHEDLTIMWEKLFAPLICGAAFRAVSALDKDDREATLTTEAVTNTVTRLVTTNVAISCSPCNELNGAPNEVIYQPDAKPPHFTCAASKTNSTTIQAFPPLLVLNREKDLVNQNQPWVEQPSNVTLRAPMNNGTRPSMQYKLVAIIQHIPGHWTVSFLDHRDNIWYFHDGMKNGGLAQRCNSQIGSIHDSADGFKIVYVQL